MDWKEISNLTENQLLDSNLAKEFNLIGHPEFPNISTLSADETFSFLSEFLKAENQTINLKNLLNYAPFFEMMLIKKNMPSIYG
ncbi:hypothetical protein P3G55_10340 [Leptospira sp. 96542]|nr:hypothetical protein [Leptospira sp. 96542]